MSNPTNPYWGSSLDDFLKEEGIDQTAKAAAAQRVITWQSLLTRAGKQATVAQRSTENETQPPCSP